MSRRHKTKSQEGYVHIQAKTQNQENYLRAIIESDVTICHGPSGSGKTYCAIGLACEWFLTGKINKIIVARSVVTCDEEVGFLPGGLDSKTLPFMAPYIEYFLHFMGESQFHSYVGNECIRFFPVAMLRGHNYENSLLILDETQNVSPKQIKLFLTRLGKGSKAILIGDEKQYDGKQNGLKFCIDNFQDVPGICVVKLDQSDILRHPIIAAIINRFEERGI